MRLSHTVAVAVALTLSLAAASAAHADRPATAAAGTQYGVAVAAEDAVPVATALADPGRAAGRVKLVGRAVAVCQKKGCWLELAGAEGGEQLRVTFKDYGYFVPADIVGCEVVVDGVLELAEQSVEEQRHYAEDAGKSPAEIAAITAPSTTVSLVADGVLVVARPGD